MTKTDYHTTAISIGDLKNGMLYFDQIIPIAIPLDFAKDFVEDSDRFGALLRYVGDEILPKDLLRNSEFADSLINVNMSVYNLMSKKLIEQHRLPPQIPDVSLEEYEKIEETFVTDYFDFIYKYKFDELPLLSIGKTGLAALPEDGTTDLPAILTLSNLKIIDVSNAPWEQIVEFRKDPTAKAKLRKLRLFAYENYTGKSKEFIEDDINGKIYDYENVAKKFGLEIVQAAVNNVVNSKLFTGVVTTSILTSLFGAPINAIITATAGSIIEIGQFTLEFKKRKYELQDLIKDNPASFITYFKEKIKNDD